jgi:hypothetical protein
MAPARQARTLAFALALAARASGQTAYVPGPGDDWQHKRPEEATASGPSRCAGR